MRTSCLKIQQAIEAREGQDGEPRSSEADVSEVAYCIHVTMYHDSTLCKLLHSLNSSGIHTILQLKEEVHQALKVSSDSLPVTKSHLKEFLLTQLHACCLIIIPLTTTIH